FAKTGTMPRFIVMSLGEDHTTGTTPGTFTPQACVASNDLALGRLVEAVSKSKYWKETAIFVIEDDAQNGPDHVDTHRTVGLVVSPYARRKHLDSTQYQTVSMVRTIELILGLAPLSQVDAAATPLCAPFTDAAHVTPAVRAGGGGSWARRAPGRRGRSAGPRLVRVDDLEGLPLEGEVAGEGRGGGGAVVHRAEVEPGGDLADLVAIARVDARGAAVVE